MISKKCPLDRQKERKQFNIHKSANDQCSFNQDNFPALFKDEYQLCQQEPFRFKLRYIDKEFVADFKSLQKTVQMPGIKDLARSQALPHTLGLPAKMTAALMREMHGPEISRGTVSNYADAAAILVRPFVILLITSLLAASVGMKHTSRLKVSDIASFSSWMQLRKIS